MRGWLGRFGWEAVKNAFWNWLFSIPLWGKVVTLFGAAALGAGAKVTGAPWPIQLLVVFAMVLIVLHASTSQRRGAASASNPVPKRRSQPPRLCGSMWIVSQC